MNWLSRATVSLVLFAASGVPGVRAEDSPGIVDWLTKAGITPSLTYDGEVAADLAGGQKRGATVVSALHVQLTFDGDKLVGVPGLTGFLDGLWIGGGRLDRFTGVTQNVSSFAAPPALRLYEAWLQYNTPDNGFSVLAGRYDMNTEFYHLLSATMFLNSSFGIGPDFAQSGLGGPSIFPNTSLGVRFAYRPIPNALLRFAILDGAPVDPVPGVHGPFDPHNGLLLVAEAAFVTRGPGNQAPSIGRDSNAQTYDGKIAVGAWYYTATFNDLSATGASGAPSRHHGESGAYLLLDHLLLGSKDDPKRRLMGFVELGVADQSVDRFGGYIGAGLTLSELIPSRPDDQLGLAAAMARNGSHYIDGQQLAGLPATAAETAIELSYLAQVTSWLSVQPDIQYVIHPNTDPLLRNAVVAQLRVEMKF